MTDRDDAQERLLKIIDRIRRIAPDDGWWATLADIRALPEAER